MKFLEALQSGDPAAAILVRQLDGEVVPARDVYDALRASESTDKPDWCDMIVRAPWASLVLFAISKGLKKVEDQDRQLMLWSQRLPADFAAQLEAEFPEIAKSPRYLAAKGVSK